MQGSDSADSISQLEFQNNQASYEIRYNLLDGPTPRRIQLVNLGTATVANMPFLSTSFVPKPVDEFFNRRFEDRLYAYTDLTGFCRCVTSFSFSTCKTP